MAQIVKAGVRPSNGGSRLLEAAVNRRLCQVVSQLVCEHKAGILPQLPGPEPLGRLGGPVTLQESHDRRGGGNDSAFSVLGRNKAMLTTAAPKAL